MLYSELRQVLSDIELAQKDIKEQIATVLTELVELNQAHNKLLEQLIPLDQELSRQQEYLRLQDYFYKLTDYTKIDIGDVGDKDQLGANFTLHSNFLYPSLFIGYNPELVPYLTSAEPLYIANWDSRSIPNILAQFNSIYQGKIRVYNLNKEDFSDLLDLPQRQFSCIVCWDIVKYLRSTNLELLLNNLIKLVRPGGVLYLNFSDSGKLANLQQVEQNLIAYHTASDIKKLGNHRLIEKIELLHTSNHTDYFKITIKGKLSTVKIQPVLGEIIPKSS